MEKSKPYSAIIYELERSNIIEAGDYQSMISVMFAKCTKTYICNKLEITRPTHNVWLKEGIRNPRQVRRIRRLVADHVTDLRARARELDKWTTSHVIKNPVPRLTYSPSI